eukprot:1322153-Pleurochrysis_carterae.AAC.2
MDSAGKREWCSQQAHKQVKQSSEELRGLTMGRRQADQVRVGTGPKRAQLRLARRASTINQLQPPQS